VFEDASDPGQPLGGPARTRRPHHDYRAHICGDVLAKALAVRRGDDTVPPCSTPDGCPFRSGAADPDPNTRDCTGRRSNGGGPTVFEATAQDDALELDVLDLMIGAPLGR
jgi:hypothetical protein